MTTYRPIESEELMENITRPNGVPSVIDVSHWQGPINWTQLYGQGVRGVIIKATNGAFQTDDRYLKNVARARDAGIRVGSYHFMLSAHDPEAQADNFLSNSSTGKKGDFLHALDVEWDMKGKTDQWQLVGPGVADVHERALVIAAMIGRYCLRIKEVSGAWPIIYSGSWWIEMLGPIAGYKGSKGQCDFGQLHFWLAAYTRLLQSKHVPTPWVKRGPSIWQYNGTGVLEGIGTILKQVDFDQLLVPVESLCFA